jgi:hypothetical protein
MTELANEDGNTAEELQLAADMIAFNELKTPEDHDELLKFIRQGEALLARGDWMMFSDQLFINKYMRLTDTLTKAANKHYQQGLVIKGKP